MKATKSLKDLDKVLAKIEKQKPSTKKAQRAQTAGGNAKIRARDLTPSAERDPYLDLITKNTERKFGKPESLATRVRAKVVKRKEKRIAENTRFEAERRIREPKAIPDELPNIMAPALRKRGPGEKPNIAALIYGHRALIQFANAHLRYHMGTVDAEYYATIKKRFHAYMEEMGLAEHFDWTDF